MSRISEVILSTLNTTIRGQSTSSLIFPTKGPAVKNNAMPIVLIRILSRKNFFYCCALISMKPRQNCFFTECGSGINKNKDNQEDTDRKM